jgi:hypothetical protein
MMRTIHKFRLDGPGQTTNIVKMDPLGKPVRVAFQAGVLQLWAEVFPEAPKTDRVFHVYGTGWPVDSGDVYVGTAVQEDEYGHEFVWHVYERRD